VASRKKDEIELKIEWLPCEEPADEQLRRLDRFLDWLAGALVEEWLRENGWDQESRNGDAA